MSEPIAAPVSLLADDVEVVLRAWAQAQAPSRSFERDRVFVFQKPARHNEGVFFVPGELVLAHPAEGEGAEEAAKRGLPRPLAVWSFELGQELLIPPGLLRAERRVAGASPTAASSAAK
jgi:hypothetical protein